MEKQFWSYQAYKKQILTNGYIRRLNSDQHPFDIIELIFKYYYMFLPSFTVNISLKPKTTNDDDSDSDDGPGYISDFDEVKWVQKTIENATLIKLISKYRIIIEPHSDYKWFKKPTISSNNIKYSLQYKFKIKCIENIFTDSLSDSRSSIGIKTCDNKNCIAYFMKKLHSDDTSTLFGFYYYDNWSKQYWSWRIRWFFGGYWLNCISVPKSKVKITNHTISLILNCYGQNWRLYWLYDEQVVHFMNIKSNKSYIPIVVVTEGTKKTIQYQVETMQCNLITPSILNTSSMNIADTNQYIFVHLTGQQLDNLSTVSTSNDVINLLWKGYKLLYLRPALYETTMLRFVCSVTPSSPSSIYRSMPKYKIRMLWIILEIYQYFHNQYIEFIQELLSKKKGFGARYYKVIGSHYYKIGQIIADFVIDDYSAAYNEYKKHDVIVADLIKSTISNGFQLNLWSQYGYYCSITDNADKIFVKLKEEQDQIWEKLYKYEFNEELIELNQNYNYNMDEHGRSDLFGNIRFKMKNNKYDKTGMLRTHKIRKKISYNKRKNDKKSNYKSKKIFKHRYQLSLQY